MSKKQIAQRREEWVRSTLPTKYDHVLCDSMNAVTDRCNHVAHPHVLVLVITTATNRHMTALDSFRSTFVVVRNASNLMACGFEKRIIPTMTILQQHLFKGPCDAASLREKRIVYGFGRTLFSFFLFFLSA